MNCKLKAPNNMYNNNNSNHSNNNNNNNNFHQSTSLSIVKTLRTRAASVSIIIKTSHFVDLLIEIDKEEEEDKISLVLLVVLSLNQVVFLHKYNFDLVGLRHR